MLKVPETIKNKGNDDKTYFITENLEFGLIGLAESDFLP